MVTATLNRVSGSAPQSLRWWAEEVLVTLGAKFGAFLTFARLDDEEGTAPGQPTVRELVDLLSAQYEQAKRDVLR